MHNQRFFLEKAIERNYLIVAPDTPLTEVIELISDGRGTDCDFFDGGANLVRKHPLPIRNICALVVDNSHIAGIFTERDIVKMIAAGRKIEGITIAEVMSREVVTLKNDEIEDVFALLHLSYERGIHHIPILDRENQVLGIITPRGIRKTLHPTEWLKFRCVSEVVNTQTIYAPLTASVMDVVKLMTQHHVSCVVIVEGELDNEEWEKRSESKYGYDRNHKLQPVGIITEWDVLQFQRLKLNLEHIQAQAVMSTPLFTVHPSDSLWWVHQKMQQHLIRRLVVTTNSGELLGVITEISLLQALDPTEMYGVLELLQQKIEQLKLERSELSQSYTEQSQLYEYVQTALEERKQIEQTLRQERNLLSTVLDVVGALVVVLDKQGKIIRFNQTCEQITGYSFKEVENKSVWDLIPPEEVESIIKIFDELKKGKFPNQHENHWLAKDGSRRLITWSNTCLLDQYGSVKYIVATGIDITQRKQAEQDRDRFFSLSVDMLCVAGLDGYFKRINPAFEKTLGYTSTELFASPLLNFIHPDDIAATLAEMDKLARGIETIGFENRYRCKDGSYKWLQWNAIPYGESLYSVARDITERKQIQEKIREQAALLNVTTDAILVKSLENQILFWNKGAERLYGFTPEEALNHNVNELLHADSFKVKWKEIQQVLFKQDKWLGELKQINKAGDNITVASRWSLMRDKEGNPKSILIVNTDITEQKKLEAQFLRAQRLESIGTLSGGIAHDLNNILTPILAIAQLLPVKVPQADEETRNLFNMLQTSAKRGGTLVKQVLSFAQGIQSDRKTLQIKDIIAEIREFARNTFPKFIQIEVIIAPDLRTVYGDATQLHQVLINLCVNARDAMPNGGKLSINARNIHIDENYTAMNVNSNVGDYIVITVSDTGVGIPPEVLERIFEPFFTTKEQGKGTGLGLSTAIGIIKNHDGFINVYSEVGKGTQFKVYLPSLQTPEVGQDNKEEIPIGKGELILLVDDEVIIRDISKTSLENHNYRVLTASDGIEAIALYAQHKNNISAVVMDMMMPSMDGLTAIHNLQRINPQVKVIAVSGLPSSEKIITAKNSGAKEFLAKPYTSKELLIKLHALIHNL